MLSNPALDVLYHQLVRAIAQRQFILLLARLSVEYEGRGASRLGEGDRMVVIKPDGAVLVHRPTGYSPVNWQPDSKILRAEMRGETLVVESVRERPRERLTLYIRSVYLAAFASGLEDKAEFIEYLDESEIRDYLLRHPEVLEEGLHPLRAERQLGEAGYADIVARDREGRYVIVEVKRVTAGQEAVRQLYRYVESLRKHNPKAAVRGILVAPAITKEARQLLNSLGLEFKRIDIQKIYREVKAEKLREKTGSRGLLEFMRQPGQGRRP